MRRIAIAAFIFILLTVLILPLFEVVVFPEWEIQFVNDDDRPVGTVVISQTWMDYSLESFSDEHQEDGLQTDPSGYIKLPKRTITVSVLRLILGKVRDAIFSINPHASSGPHSTISCTGDHNCLAYLKLGTEQPQRVLLRPKAKTEGSQIR